MSKDNYKLLANDYDFLNPKEEIFRQKPFFEKLISSYSVRTCLDCACGTGWHLFMLDELGVSCCGSDLSGEMLALARRNLKGKNIPLKLQDFRRLSSSWKQSFDMVICMTTALPHMLTGKDAVVALKSMYGRLNDGGILVVANGISDHLLDFRPKFLPGRILKDRAFYFFLEYPNPRRIIFNILQVKETKESFEHSYDVIEYNAMRKSSLETYFGKTKFKKVGYFGDFSFARYSARTSQRLIAIAQK